MMRRVINWDVKLLLWANDLAGSPFHWGETDCGSLVRAALEVMYGAPVITAWPYTTRAAAVRASKESGGGVEAVLRAHGAYDVNPRFAQQGDIVIEAAGDSDGFPSSGIIVAGTVLRSSPEIGVGFSSVKWSDLPDAVVLRYPHG